MRWFWRQGRYDIFCSSISWYVCNVAHTMTYGMYGLTQVVTYLCCHDEDLNCHIGQFFPPRTEVHLDQSKCQLKWSNSAPEIHGQPHVPRTQTHTHTLCEPAQSKCTWRFHKSNFIQKFTGEMPAPRMSPERRHTLCASLRSRNALGNFTRATLYRNLKEKCLCPEWTQNADTHFAQACAVEMHLETFTRATLHEHLQVKAADQEQAKLAPQILCEPAKSKCTWRFHKSHCMRKFAGKMPRPRMSTLIKPTVRTPQCGRGNKNNNYNIYSYNYTYNNINCNYS